MTHGSPAGGQQCSVTSNLRMRFCSRASCCVVMASSLRSATILALCYPQQPHAIGPRSDPRQSVRRASHSFVALELAYDCLNRGAKAPMEAIHDFDQLQLHFVDHVQWRYELIRRWSSSEVAPLRRESRGNAHPPRYGAQAHTPFSATGHARLISRAH